MFKSLDHQIQNERVGLAELIAVAVTIVAVVATVSEAEAQIGIAHDHRADLHIVNPDAVLRPHLHLKML